MRRCAAVFLIVSLTAVRVEAMRSLGFGLDAFNVAAAGKEDDFVFSPSGFELDAVVFAQTQNTINRAAMTERLGAIIGLDNVYGPIFKGLSDPTNGLSVLSARGFCVPEPELVRPALRSGLAQDYGVSFSRIFPADGAEAWFRAAMEGWMEMFSVVVDKSGSSRYAFYDLEFVRTAWAEPFPMSNTRNLPFSRADGSQQEIPFMTDVREALTYANDDFTMLELPMKGENRFFAFLPKDGKTLADVRRHLVSGKAEELTLISSSVVIRRGVRRGPTVIGLPVFETVSKVDLIPLMQEFRFPYSENREIAEGGSAREIAQFARFRLDGHGLDEPVDRKPPEDEVRVSADAEKLFFNRPFVFFVLHDGLQIVTVAGQFMGVSK